MIAIAERAARWFVAFSRSQRGAIIGAALGLSLMAGLCFQLVREWNARGSVLADADIRWFVAGGVAVLGAAFFGAAGWRPALRSVGARTDWPTSPGYYLGQLGKYLPGGAWPYLGRGAFAARAGIPLRTSGASFAVEIAAAIAVALMAAPLALGASPVGLLVGTVGSLVIAAALVITWPRLVSPVARRWLLRATGGGSLRLSSLPRLILIHGGAALSNGISLWATAFAFGSVPISRLPLFIGAASAAWLIGFLILFAPGGLGIREIVLVAVLGAVVSSEVAVAVAVVSRLQLVAVDLLTAAGAWLYLSTRRVALAVGAPGNAEPDDLQESPTLGSDTTGE